MPLKTQQDEQPTLNLTPMIDVVFLLIIFFMVATKFSELERNIEISVPQVAEAGQTAEPPRPLVVNVYADGRIELDSRQISLDALTGELTRARAEQGDPTVVIRGDGECEFQDVAAALAACRAANISELGITVRVAAGSGANPVR